MWLPTGNCCPARDRTHVQFSSRTKMSTSPPGVVGVSLIIGTRPLLVFFQKKLIIAEGE